MKKPIKMLLVDDHALVRSGLRSLLEDEFVTVTVEEAARPAAALELVGSARWDLVLLDLSLPGRGGLELLKDIVDLRPELPVLVVTMHAGDQYALRAFRAGASGYVSKTAAAEELFDAIRRVLGGGKYVPPEIGEVLASSLSGQADGRPHDALSDRELQVLRHLAAGLTVKETAQELNLSDKTVSTYRTRILEKLEMRTTAELIRYAIRANLVD